uniref:Rhomboid domain containing 1 n=1 Tax=Strix occidentalis caurina TaxID=311401 RepID=A0A8D0F0D2_STROC
MKKENLAVCPCRTSFAGHLAGILVGLMYTMGPLKKIMKACTGIYLKKAVGHLRNYYWNSQAFQQCYYGYPGYQYRTPRNYYDYTGGLTEEEQLERAVLNSLNERGRNFMHFIFWERCIVHYLFSVFWTCLQKQIKVFWYNFQRMKCEDAVSFS